ncbi:MAG: right-handed parallel beta-helix repeat-containing protein [Planctomycetota bacterium]|jgi:hypothetical protein
MGSAVKTFYSSFKFKRRPKTRRVLSLFFLIVAGGTCFPLTTEVAEAATTYYLDAVNGDDSYPGTSGLPWQTLAKAQTTASAGDTVYLFGGSYGNFDETDVTRTDWLTYKAVDGQTPVFTRIHIARGSLGDVYLIFDGITVNCSADDGEHLSLSKCRYVKFLNMSINAPGYTTGDYTKTMPLWSSEYVTIDNCTFTGTGADYEGGRMYAVRGSLSNHIYVTNCTMNQHGKGIVADGDYWTVTNNHIYNMDADGIIIVNCNNCLVAYNHIHDLEPAPGSGEHVDLIQVNYAVSHNVTIRGNNCYNSERQGFFINPQTASNYLIENNLVHSCNMYGGASNEVTVHNINGITFRNNTIDGNLLGGGPAVWTQLCNNIVKRLDINVDGGTSIQYENYNFIRYWWIHMTTHRPGVNSVTLNTDEAFYSLFADAQNGDYQLHDASPAKDFCLAAISPAYDLLGNLRDATPDAGCYEYISGPTDTTPPPPPQNLSATPVSESQIDLSWQASVDPESGISHYKVYRDGSPVGTSVSPAYSDTGLNPGTTYSYQVSAVNGGGLESNRSTTAQAATPLDTTPPEIVSVLASETQVSISFSEALDTPSAEDTANYSITGGVSIISASLSATLAEVTLTTSAHAEGTYTLTVINVKDRNGNPLPQTSINYEYSEGLAGYWKFDEGEGLQAIDSSGMGNTGTLINGPAWTSGKVGGALSFDGFDDYVQIGATDVAVPWAAALWVRRADSSNSNAALLESSGYSLKLEQYPDTNKLGFTAFGVGDYTFNYEAPVGAWVHLVFVATATETNLYVNGILTDTIPYSVPCPMGQISSASPSRPAKGLIDEVRIYNRVLTGAEILDLYNEGAAQDTTAPVISNVQASDISDSGATITWTTDENATSQVEYGLDTSYGSSTNADTNLVMSHLILLGGLAPGTLYHYRVRSKDAAANESVSEDKTFSTTTAVTYNLVVTAVHGTVVRSPDKASYSYGETVILEAVPDTGYHFVDWSGAVTGGSNPVSVVMDADKSVTASFAVNTYTLGITAERTARWFAVRTRRVTAMGRR